MADTTNRPDESVLQAAETAIREIVGKHTMDLVLYEGRAQVTDEAQKLMQATSCSPAKTL